MAGKQKGDANLNNLRKQLDQIVGKLQSIQRNINEMREAGKSAKQIYKEYGKELESLAAKEETLNKEIQERKKLTKDNADTFSKYVKLENQSNNKRKAIFKELSDIEQKAFKSSEKARESGLKQQDRRNKASLKANDKLELTKIRQSRLSVNKRLRAELDLLNKQQRRYRQGSAEYKRIEQEKVKATAKALRDRDSIIKKYRGSRITEDTKGGFLGGLQKGFSASELGKGIGRLTGIGTVLEGFRRLLGAVRQALVGSFKAAVDFEAQLAQLQAVTGINNDELSRLEKNILDVAGSTKFTSEQIVELQTELGKLGFSVDEIEKATLAVAETAQALGEQVGPVAQKIGQILNQFNLTASETVNVSDTLVSVINSSALSFEGFGTALQYIGPLGAEVGTTFRETSTAMAILADNGFTASRIGTGLRGILTELSTTGKDLKTVITELADAEISLGEAVDLVGKRNAAQLITLIDNLDVLDDLENKYYNTGAAAIASAQQIDTYAGNLDLLKSAFNRVQIEFGNFLKYSGLVRAALKLLDEQGYRTALAMEFLSNIDPQNFSESLSEAADNALALADASGKFANKQQIYAEAAKGLFMETLSPLQREYLENEKELAAFEAQKFGVISEEESKRRRYLKDRQEALRDYKISEEERLAIEEQLTLQVERQAKTNALLRARNEIEEEYSERLKEFQGRRDDEELDLEKALKLRTEINADAQLLKENREAAQAALEKERETLKGLISDGAPKEIIETSKQEIELAETRLEQYDQEITNLTNVNLNKEQLFELAQKEYELEFAALRNSIAERKERLSKDEELLNIQIKTNQNEIDALAIKIENAKTDKERNELANQQKKLLEEQSQAEIKRAELQKEANEDVQGYLNQVRDELKSQESLWREAGFSPESLRILEKATERLDQMTNSVSELALDFPEAVSAADNLVKSLQDRFADTLKNGGVLSEKDKQEINKIIGDTFAGFELTEEQQEAISEYIYSGLKPGKKTKEDVLKEAKKLLDDIFGEIVDAAKAYNETALQNTTNRLKAEIDAIKNRYDVEQEILKSQLDNQLITENQFRLKQRELRRAQLAEENTINRQIFEAQKKADLNVVGAETSEALFSNILNNYDKYDFTTAGILSILSTVAVAAAGAAKADAIRRRKFYPVKFEEGGMVQGPSHAEGGVPFTVQGRGGYEMEGGEFIVNKKAASLHRGLLERINSSYKVPTSPSQYKFASGGLVTAKADESVDYLKAIAEATVSTAINSSKPVRAYVSDKDLRSNATERRIRDRNDRL